MANVKDPFKTELVVSSGTSICKKLKFLYPELGWLEVGLLYADLKKALRCLYEHYGELQFTRELEKYSEEDLREAVELHCKKKPG